MTENNLDILILHTRMAFLLVRSPMIALGTSVLASYLEKQHLRTRVIDDNSPYKTYSLSDYKRRIQLHNPPVIGFSMSTLNAYSSYQLARELKKLYPDTLFIAGGLHSYDSYDEMAKESYDIIFRGEAEIPLTAFLKYAKNHIDPDTQKIQTTDKFWEDIKSIPGMLIKNNGTVIDTGPAEILTDLDTIPFTNYDLLNIKDYLLTSSDHINVTNSANYQRGCPYKCTFCKSEILPAKIRSNSPGYVIDEIEERYAKYGFDTMQILDSNFTIQKRRLEEFCSLMISSGLSKKLSLYVQTSISTPLTDAQITHLKEAGVVMISLGIERFDDEFRTRMKKNGSGERAANLLKQIHAQGIKTNINILVNFPYETTQSLEKESALLYRSLKNVSFFYINYLMPMPGTELYDKNESMHQWYLGDEFNNHKLSYYELAYHVTSPALNLNPFQHSKKLMEEIRFFKEKFHKVGGLKLTNSRFFKILFRMDLTLGKISFFIGKLSPAVERKLFSPLCFIRMYGYKWFYSKYVMKFSGSRQRKWGISDSRLSANPSKC